MILAQQREAGPREWAVKLATKAWTNFINRLKDVYKEHGWIGVSLVLAAATPAWVFMIPGGSIGGMTAMTFLLRQFKNLRRKAADYAKKDKSPPSITPEQAEVIATEIMNNVQKDLKVEQPSHS